MMITVTEHAFKQTKARFPQARNKTNRWIDTKYRESKLFEVQESGRKVFVHPTENVFIVTDAQENEVITVINKEEHQLRVKTPFLDAVLVEMEKEMTKMHRTYRAMKRDLERQIAEEVIKRGEALLKRSRVYNPKTQEILMQAAVDSEVRITELEAQLTGLQMQYDASVIKLNRFLVTARGEKLG